MKALSTTSYYQRLWYLGVLSAIVCLVLLPAVAKAAEAIDRYVVDITVRTDGTFQVEETIQYDFGDVKRHGIFRTWPRAHPQSSGTWYTDRVIDINIISVERGSGTALYTRRDSSGEVELQIGDPDRTITGTHTYTIIYDIAGALTHYDDGDIDLYWNVTGDEWSVPIEETIVRVTGVGILLDRVGRCYVGQAGSNASCSEVNRTGDSVTFIAERLPAGSGITIAQALDANVVALDVREEWNLWWVWILLGLLWMFGIGLYSYLYYQKYNPRHAVVTQFAPYADFKPMFTGVLLDGTLHNRDITAGILYLAEQGFVRIRKTEATKLWLFTSTDYELELLRNPEDTETTFQRELLHLLFGEQPQCGDMVSLQDVAKSSAAQKRNQTIIKRLKQGIEADLVTRGFYEEAYRPALRQAAKAVLGLAVFAAMVLSAGMAGVEFIIWVVVLGMATVTFFLTAATRRTSKGHAARNHLLGFKRFLAMTGTERFAFHDAPEKSPEQFTEYLPYAVAFAVEKEWAEVFADVTIPQPSWYVDVSGSHQFAAGALVNDLGAFSQSFSQSAGSSASSGGGSAGGGAGGGGGGSW